MDPRAAKGIAANIRIIAENTAQVALIDSGTGCNRYANEIMSARISYLDGIEKAENAIAQWLQQPMTTR